MLRVVLPWPPSVNAMWRTPRSGPLAGRTMLSREGREYRVAVDAVVRKALQSALPAAFADDDRLRVSIEARMPDRRKRDLDNLPKAILDALTHAGVWGDDGQIDDLRVWRSDRMGGCVVVTITRMQPLRAQQMDMAAVQPSVSVRTNSV